MTPVIALVGRPNVGKSTLFNCLTQSKMALVADQPGVTRDRLYGRGQYKECAFIVVDTGGIGRADDDIASLAYQQAQLAIDEADILLFLVDGRDGLHPDDRSLAKRLRSQSKTIHLVINKTDGLNTDIAQADFYQLGLGEPMAIAASHGRGVKKLLQSFLAPYAEQAIEPEHDDDANDRIALCVVGRPNVGKSTCVNCMLGEPRVVVCDQPGTTLDSVAIPFQHHDQAYTLIDTAGVRRRARVNEALEKFSVIKTLQAIEQANVVLFLLNAQEGITEQDRHLLSYVLRAGRALVVAVNKWDGLAMDQKEKIKSDIERRLDFVDFAKIRMISALHGTGVGDLYRDIEKAYRSAMQELPTSRLNKILEAAVAAHPPPLVNNRRIKLRYAHAGGKNPPLIVIHGNQVSKLTDQYQRYLISHFRKSLKLVGTPIRINFQEGKNPYEGRKNKLTLSQQRKRKRLLKHVKKK